ncbi:MAG: imidazole glycerol phosphate synthase cyclase subunit, partial [Candidatus Taylorbacteria bacterium RIFCSPLOWO2_01_FULL_50_130]
MSKNIRIIPTLHVKGPNVVKPVHTEALRVVGNPKELAARYYQEGADELIYLDIVASLYQRNLDFELLKSVTEDIFIPVTVGGGIRSIHDINNALRAGADKVAINTFGVSHPDFIREAAREFGSQCIVLYIEAKKQEGGSYEAYTDGGREHSGVGAIEWAKRGIKLGAGEILISSIDRDGTKKGFDIELARSIASRAPIPVIAHGGAGS